MTSLAAQLKKLALPETQNLLGSGLKQASFLYPEGEAATYDKQHFYNIGINGLQQLIEKDETFQEFEQNLFAPSSQSLQRYVQTVEVNKQLDESISSFLHRLSPYMQLREAHKAMEWMVHRYNVHLRNVDVFMMCVLPYHDEDVFLRAIRLLKLNSKECATWRWLEPVKKAEIILPRQTLITHTATAKGFLGFLCEMLLKNIEANTDESGSPSSQRLQRVISFYTQVVLGVLLTQPANERIISTLIPTIGAGLRAIFLPDFQTSSYMILSQLLVQSTLDKSLLESLLNVLCKNVQSELMVPAVGVVVIMFQRQTIERLPKKAFKNLLRCQSVFIQTLINISKEVDVELFLTPFLSSLTRRALRQSVGVVTSESNAEDDEVVARSPPALNTLLVDVINSITLKDKTVTAIIREMLIWFCEQEKSFHTDIDNEASPVMGAFRIFKILENRFSCVMEKVVKQWNFDKHPFSKKKLQSTVESLHKLSIKSAVNDLENDPESSVIICLHHHNGNVRKNAVEKLLDDPSLIIERDGVEEALVLRLQDDDPKVVAALLENYENLWKLFDNHNLLEETLIKKLLTLKERKDCPLTKLILTALTYTSYKDSNKPRLRMLFLSHLLPWTKEDIDIIKNILSGYIIEYDEFLRSLSTAWVSLVEGQDQYDEGIDPEEQVILTETLIGHVATYLECDCSDTYKFLQEIYDFLPSYSRSSSAAFVLLMSQLTFLKKAEEIQKIDLQHLIVNQIVDMNIKKIFIESPNSVFSMKSCLDTLKRRNKLPLNIITHVVQQLKLQPLISGITDLMYWQSVKTSEMETLVNLTTFLLKLSYSPSSRAVAKENFPAIYKVLGNNKSMLKFLCMMCTTSAHSKSNAHYLQFTEVFISSLNLKERLNLIEDLSPSLPCVLVLLTDKFESVRNAAFTILYKLTEGMSLDGNLYVWTVKHLLKYRVEVTKDATFLPQVMKNILEDDETVLSSPSPKKRRKSSSNTPMHLLLLNFLHSVLEDSIPSDYIKAGILRAMQHLDTVESFLPVPAILQKALDKTVNAGCHLSDEEKEMINLLISRYSVTVAPCLEPKSQGLSALEKALTSNIVVQGDTGTVQVLAIEQISSKFMSALTPETRQLLVSQLLNLISTSTNPVVVRRSNKVMKKMVMEASIIVDEIKKLTVKNVPSTVRESKKTRKSEEDKNTDLNLFEWKRITCLLELIQNKKKITGSTIIVQPLFQLLARVVELEEEGSGEYLKQLVLGTVHNVCLKHQKNSSNEEGVKGEHLNMELVVHCIRSSDNPHTHQQALLLLSTAAHIAPTLLLHNMMSVFTFMGDNILRQDDAYSFDVIGRILNNVIPALVLACEEKSKEKSSMPSKESGAKLTQKNVMTVVMRVFVEAMPHVPAHRRMPLCQNLVSVLGEKRYLWRLLMLFLERVTVRPTHSVTEENTEDVTMEQEEKSSGPMSVSDLDFLIALCEKFPVGQLLHCFKHALIYLSELPEEKHGSKVTQRKTCESLEEMSSEDMEVFSITQHSAKQLRHFKFATLFTLHELVASQGFIAQMSSEDPKSFIKGFQSLMETVLQFISQVTQSHDKFQGNNSARFWRILLNKCHDLLDSLVNILPDALFLDVVSSLMEHELCLVQRRALELLNTKLIYFKENSEDIQVDLLTSLTGKLEALAHKTLLDKSKKNEEDLVIGQAALYGLKVLCRILGDQQQEHFVKVLKLSTSVLANHHDNGVIAASAMLVIAEVVSTYKAHTISQLGTFVPLIISQLKSETIMQHESLLLASVSSLQKIIDALPLFLSPYLLNITIQLCLISTQLDNSSKGHRPVVLHKVKMICTTIATATPTRTFLPVLQKSFVALDKDMAACAACAMSMLRDHVVKMTREELTTFSQDLLQFFLICFDLRITHPQITENDLDTIETCVIDAFVSLVFKLSESQFKPMLIKLYGWATDEDADVDRALVFYRLCFSLAEKLKNLFTLFAGHILKHAANTLDLNNKTKQKVIYFGKGKSSRAKSNRLLLYVTDCLQKTFAHDTEGFVNKERFEIVMQPLVDQLDNSLGSSSTCEDRVMNHVVPCLGRLAAAVQDDSLWKTLNYQILLKTRSEDPKVRIYALHAVDAFHRQLGEDYTQLVPETIPFLAELMEDESDDVEKQTQKVLAAMETSVGENLQEYF